MIFVFPAIFIFAALAILQRKVGIQTAHPRISGILFNGMAGVLAFALFLFSGGLQHLQLPTTLQPWIFLGLAGLFYGLYERYRFSASKYLEASILVVINNWSFIVGFLGVLLLYQENITIMQLVGAGLILCSIILVSLPKKDKPIKVAITKLGLLFGFLTSSLIGLAQVFDKAGAENFSPALYSIIVWLTPILFVLFPKVKVSDMAIELKQSGRAIFVMALLNVVGYYLALKALEVSLAVKVVPILQISSVLTVLLAAVFLKERKNLKLKLLATSVALAGLWLLM